MRGEEPGHPRKHDCINEFPKGSSKIQSGRGKEIKIRKLPRQLLLCQAERIFRPHPGILAFHYGCGVMNVWWWDGMADGCV